VTIPVNEPLFGERELAYVADCVRSGWVSSAGSYLESFEERWAGYCGRRYGVAVANGTVALQAAIAAIGLKPGDEVILPSFTIISCATAVLYNGGTPVLVDCDPDTWCMDPDQVAARVTARTRAIMPVHIYGHPVDMDPLMHIAERHGLAIVEDAAEAHGAEYLSGRDGGQPVWRRCGSFGAASCFSFYANKLVTTGEGGMVVTDDAAIAERLRRLRNLCFGRERRFVHDELGHNFRLTNLQAALGLAQLDRIGEIVESKRRTGREYVRRLGQLGHLQVACERPWARSVYWMNGIVVSEASGLDASTLAERLLRHGVETRPFFVGMHEQPALLGRGLFAGERFPVTERLARQGLYLPSGLALQAQQLADVCAAVGESLA